MRIYCRKEANRIPPDVALYEYRPHLGLDLLPETLPVASARNLQNQNTY